MAFLLAKVIIQKQLVRIGEEKLYLWELEQLLGKVKSLEVMLQNINMNTDKPQLEEGNKDIESYLH